jgi:hypothetical protein
MVMYGYYDGATQGWTISCMTEMVHITQYNYHDVDQ